MKVDIRHNGIVEKGQVKFYLPDLYHDNLRIYEGKQVYVIVKPIHKKPSLSQYGYYRGGILVTCHQSEMFSHYANKDEIHDDYFAPMFLTYKKLVTTNGITKEVIRTRSLADLSQEEMSGFIEKVIYECEANGISIASPDQYYNKYYHDREK